MKTMLCDICKGEMIERVATEKTPYKYEMSGLDNVHLIGLRVLVCSKCEVEAPIIPRMAELHKVIANIIVKQPYRLRGKEIRFLRKNAGFPANKFAALLGVDPSHLSRVENEKKGKPLGPGTDRLVRTIAVMANEGEDAIEMLLRLADEPAVSRVKHPMFKLVQNHWRLAA
jgi:YgiT-type zinc finger domain-containing protein